MTHQLEEIFEELGVAQYLDTFVDQGFDTWETILDITESDLDALGVKLGHRRKLQRRIANSRGLAPQISLVSPTHFNTEDGRIDGHRLEANIPKDPTPAVITKRKYRRHPKHDENAPERPPSAYVLFSNKMREDLKGRNLTFTEIAKLVGENWQNLSPGEKEPYESQAQAAKETYNIDLVNYKKTPEYRKYAAYLQEFKVKYSHQAQEKDASKRVRLAEAGVLNHNGSSANATPDRTSRSGSGSDGPVGNEQPHPTRQRRMNSTVSSSGADTQYPSIMTPGSHHPSIEDSVTSPVASVDHHSERSPTYGSTSPRDISAQPGRRNSGWIDDHSNQRSLPSLSDVFDNRSILNSAAPGDVNGFTFHRGPITESPGPVPGLVNGDKPPPLNKDQSSSGSVSSGSSYGFPRTPIEGSLPIHALLGTSKPPNPYEVGQPSPMYRGGPTPTEHHPKYQQYPPSNGVVPAPPPMTNGYHTLPPPHHGSPVYTAQPAPQLSQPAHHSKPSDPDLDGMSALLKAGEIVDRRLG